MNHPIRTAKTHIISHKRDYIIGTSIVVIFAVLAALYLYNNPPKTVYKAQDACALFTPAKAQDLLGNHVINVNTNRTTIDGNVGTSKCSYTDSNANQGQMKVAAVAIRSGVNDEGVTQNKTEFAHAKATSTMQAVQNIGTDAFFNPARGQLNILSDRMWIIVSNGIGATPESNTLSDDLTLAHKVLSN